MVEKNDKAPVNEAEDDIDIDLDYLLEEGLEATDKEEKKEKKVKKTSAPKKPPVRKSAAKKEAPKAEMKKRAVKESEENKPATKKAVAKKKAPETEKDVPKKRTTKVKDEKKPAEKKVKTSVKEEKTDSAAKKEKKTAEKKTTVKKESAEKSVPAPKKKKVPAKAKKVKKEAKPAEEDVLVVEDEKEEEGVYVAKLKPALPDDVQTALKERSYRKRHQPDFKRQEWFRYKRLGTAWRRPKGIQSKMRRHFKYRINIVSIGYGTNRLARNLHPSGFEEVLVYRPLDLEDMDPTLQAARIGHSVGSRKREKIEKRAKELGIRVLNRSG